ncbi:glycosyltransferase N-terminal domain-containing protein [Flavobacteriaceae bacterium S356]|uniref:3-deoxy-D-manno-octulosonic acid transferase n=1 Tax=Asprobacillus argus TaxID=3076534 RepID=A0ABU3LGD5_9FLAO|nr:glycosyltransferase N-terminal domain-containing protein [Flavobacteriaceae bacterium S356]
MNFLYNISAQITFFFLRIVAQFNPKMKLFIQGRKEAFSKLSELSGHNNVIWFHAASLGEFEQGRPVIEAIKREYPTRKILVTFFSPSGYEIQKDYELADVVCYLPFDTKRNVKKFVNVVQPELAIFIKYEFWPNLLNELNAKSIPAILVSGIFRKDQSFFKSYGAWFRKTLKTFDHFFVQDVASKELLENIKCSNVSVSGDTRFDRVFEILQQDNRLDFVEKFKDGKYTMVAGSTWSEDEHLFVSYINKEASENEKFIIAPHNMNEKAIRLLKESIHKKTVLFSEKEGKTLEDYQVLIVDTVGLLTKVYSYADAAYVGGGLSSNGVHNILEPATFGIPVVIGNYYSKFKEAVDLVALKGCISIKDQSSFSTIFIQLKTDRDFRGKTGAINRKYVEENIGATSMIMSYISKQLNT